jgi:hypothetical protein
MPTSDETGRAGPVLVRLAAGDNVVVAGEDIGPGTTLRLGGSEVTTAHQVGLGFKLASELIGRGAAVRRGGIVIGTATADIVPGELVHVHNLRSNYIDSYGAESRGADS